VSFTSAQLAAKVLERLKVVVPPDTAEVEDLTTVSDFYTGSTAELRADNLVYWDDEDIPDEAFLSTVDLIAGRIAPNFGLNRPDLEESGMSRLRRIGSQGPTGRSVTADFF
jgi:hypothetical protein